MAEAIGVSIFEIIFGKLVAPIGRQFKYVFCYNSNIKNMEVQVKDLVKKKDDVGLSVDAAERNLKVVGHEVNTWMKDVDEVKVNADGVLEGTKKVKNGCLNGWCPNLKQRYLLSRQAMKQTEVVAELQEKGNKYTKLAYPAPPVGIVHPPATADMTPSTSTGIAYPAPPAAPSDGSKVFQSRILRRKEILEALKDDQISIIGICGLGGVGKTTMVKDVRERVKAENLFDGVAMAIVSQNQNEEIQNQLAEMLGFEDLKKYTNAVARAELLHQRLTKGRFLVILDDLWKELDFGELGLPVVGGGECKGCKVLLTSRMEQVCVNMNTQRNFPVQVLSEKEAWELFKEKAGDCVETIGLRSIAEDVAKECGGLPLAIVTVGNALKKKYQKHAWEDALQQLKTSTVINIAGMHAKVYASLALSYNYLESDEIKSLLLLCCLFPEDSDIWIEHLFRYGEGLRLFKQVPYLADTRNRVNTLVDELRSCYLLLEGGKEGTVKMHDVVRDFGLDVASKDEHVYMVRHDAGMEKWLQNDMIKEAYTAISLGSQKKLELPTGLDCSRLKLLRIVTNAPLQISPDFYGEMKEVRVIHVDKMHFSRYHDLAELPPKAPQFLTSLQTLCLEFRKLGANMGLIGSLQNLEILSFYESEIDVLPSEIRQLSKLKLLDLRCRILNFIPSGVLSSLNKLEELYMGRYFIGSYQMNSALITELKSLSHLNTLQVYTSSDGLLQLKDFRFEELKRFDFSTNVEVILSYQMRNGAKLRNIDVSELLGTRINDTMRICEELYLKKVEGLENIVKELDGEGFINLRALEIMDCKDLIEICSGILPEGSFGRLQKVRLMFLPAMKHFLRGPIQPPCLSNLRVLRMEKCDAITSLFPLAAVKCLVQLEELHLSWCSLLEEIVSKEGAEDEKDAKTIVFPKLYRLELSSLPSLRSVVTVSDVLASENNHEEAKQHRGLNILEEHSEIVLGQQQKMKLTFMPKLTHILNIGPKGIKGFQNLTLLVVKECDSLRYLVSPCMAKFLVNLETITIESCKMMEEVIQTEGAEDEKDAKTIVFPQLQTVNLKSLPKLAHIWKMGPKGIQGFQNLTSLVVERCDSLRYLVSPCMTKFLVNLERIRIERCKMMEEVIQTEEAEDEKDAKTIVFPKLYHLELSYLPSLRSVVSDILVSQNNHEEAKQHRVILPSIDTLQLRGLNNVVHIVGGLIPVGSYKPRVLKVYNCEKVLHIATSEAVNLLQNLEELDVMNCDSLEMMFDLEGLNILEEHSEIVLGQLQKMELTYMPKLTHILNIGPKGIKGFQNLTSLVVKECDSLRYLVSPCMAKFLVNLETITIESCKMMEEVIQTEGAEDEKDAKTIVFPKLYHLELLYLPSLRSVVSDILVSQNNHEEAKQHRVILPSIDKLELDGLKKVVHIVGGILPVGSCKPRVLKVFRCEKVLHIATSDAINLLQNLEVLDVWHCDSLEMVFDMEELNILEEHSEIVLGQLQKMNLWWLPKLTHIWKMGSKGIQGFQNLTSLVVEGCDSLRYLVSPCMAKILVNLETITIKSCKMMEEVIQTEGAEDEKDAKTIVFPQLRNLRLGYLENLTMFCDGNQDIEVPSLDYVSMDECPKMKYFCSGPLTAPKLKSVALGDDK